MKIEDQVAAFEQAKKLVALGVKIDTQFYWVEAPSDLRDTALITKAQIDEADSMGWFNPIPAPTVAELGLLLPKEMRFKNIDGDIIGSLTFYFFEGEWVTDYMLPDSGESLETFIGRTEAQARAEALIWLLENNYLNPKDLKL